MAFKFLHYLKAIKILKLLDTTMDTNIIKLITKPNM